MLNLDFDRQKIIGNCIVDFYCTEKQAVLEIDGRSHDNKEAYDVARDAFIKAQSLTMIHIQDIDVRNNLPCVMDFLKSHPALTAPT